MAKSSIVLRALGLLGLEEVLKLSEVASERHMPLKKAVGEDLLAWDGPQSKKRSRHRPDEGGQILEFPNRKSIHEFSELENAPPPSPPGAPGEEGDERPSLISSDMLLWQRELSKETGVSINKVDAFKGYQKFTQMYVVKTESPEGKQTIRFASTDGILINKKQS